MALALVTSGCSSLGEDPPEIERVQRVAEGEPTGDKPAKGPGPRVLTQAWRVTGPALPSDDPNPDVKVAGGQLLFGTSRRIDVYDQNTGERRWHYGEPGRDMNFATSGDAVVVNSTTKEGDPVTTGLDLATGEVLWERTFTGSEGSPEVLRDGSGIAAADGIVPLFAEGEDDEGPGELIALDARTGEERWTRTYSPALVCDSPDYGAASDTDGSVLVMRESCSLNDEDALHAFDPATGRPLWSRSGRTDFGARVSVRRGATLIVLDENTRVIVGRDGKDMADLRRLPECSNECTLVKAGDGVAVRHGSVRGSMATLVDKGRLRQVFTDDDPRTTAVVGGDMLYKLRFLYGNALPPAGLVIADPKSGKVSEIPLPVGVDLGTQPPVLGTAGDLLLLMRGRQITAYRAGPAPGPVELGGVPEKDWPKACPLLDDLDEVKKRREDTEPVEAGTTTIDLPRCTFSYEGSDFLEEARVRILWVAPDAKGAAPLLTGEPDEGADAVEDDPLTDLVRVRTGRYIVGVEAPDQDLDEIIASVVKALK